MSCSMFTLRNPRFLDWTDYKRYQINVFEFEFEFEFRLTWVVFCRSTELDVKVMHRWRLGSRPTRSPSPSTPSPSLFSRTPTPPWIWYVTHWSRHHLRPVWTLDIMRQPRWLGKVDKQYTMCADESTIHNARVSLSRRRLGHHTGRSFIEW